MYRYRTGAKSVLYFLAFSGSSKIPSASSLRRASSKAQVCILAHVSISIEESSMTKELEAPGTAACLTERQGDHRRNLRGIGLEDVCNTSNQEAANESVVPDALPALFHVLVARLDAKQPTGRRVVMIPMVCGTKARPSREVVSALGLAQQTARTEDVRHRPGRHVEDGVRGRV